MLTADDIVSDFTIAAQLADSLSAKARTSLEIQFKADFLVKAGSFSLQVQSAQANVERLLREFPGEPVLVLLLAAWANLQKAADMIIWEAGETDFKDDPPHGLNSVFWIEEGRRSAFTAARLQSEVVRMREPGALDIAADAAENFTDSLGDVAKGAGDIIGKIGVGLGILLFGLALVLFAKK